MPKKVQNLGFISRGEQVMSSSGMGYVSLKESEVAVIFPMVNFDAPENIKVNQHSMWKHGLYFPCITGGGEVCPGCEAGDKPVYRAFIPVMHNDEVKIFPYGKTVASQLYEFNDAFDGFAGTGLKVMRKGAGKATRYVVISANKEMAIEEEVPDTTQYIGPLTRADILELMQSKGFAPVSSDANDEEEWDAV